MKKRILIALMALLGVVTGSAQSYKVYTGLMHAHTMISDGSGTPEEAYKMAKQNGLNFFALTEHNHAKAEGNGGDKKADGVLIATNPDLYNGFSNVTVTRNWKEDGTAKTEKITVKPLIKSAQAASNSTFIALYGQEFSTISSGNHMNVIGVDELITVPNGDFKGLVALMEQLKQSGKRLPIIQMNHPGVSADLKTGKPNDYGIDDADFGPDFKNMAAKLNPYVRLIEVLSGPAMSEEANPDFHYSKTHENDYYFYLTQGLQISPSAGQDNHYKTWGASSNARIGILATSLSEQNVFDAISNNRTFATEDANFHAYFTVNGNIMGSSIHSDDGSELNIELKVTDKDEPAASYQVYVYTGEIVPVLASKAVASKSKDGLTDQVTVKGNGQFHIRNVTPSANPSFVFLKIVQDDGDRLWTAPVWLNKETTTGTVFYWTSKNTSRVYHQEGCTTIEAIGADNLVSGATPPAGRTPHKCVLAKDLEE